MSFIQLGFLTALAALAIPIVVHLVFRVRAKRVDLGTLRFLREVLEHNANSRRVMRWLLLALRLAVVALLAFLFARPYLLAARAAGEKKTVVVLLDRSASMELLQEGQRLIDRAAAGARELVQNAPDNARFEIAWFDHAVEPLLGASTDKTTKNQRDASRSEQLAALNSPEACHGGTHYGAALEWARDILAKAPPGPRELHIFTDLQQSGLAWSEVDELPEDVVSHLHDLGRPAVNNLAVVEARPERAWLRPDEETSLHVSIYNGGPFPVDELPVALKLAGGGREVTLRETVKIDGGTIESLKFALPPLSRGLWKGTVSIETEDDRQADNARHVAVLAAPPYQVLLINGRPARSAVLRSTYFLDSALRLAPDGEQYSASLYEPRQIDAGDAMPSLDGIDVIVLSDVGDQLPDIDVREIAAFVKRGGGLLVFGGESVTADKTAGLAAAGLMVGRIQGVHRASDLPLRLAAWNVKHPIFSAFSDPQLGDLARLPFTACTKIAPEPDAVVLAKFKDGTPAVIEKKLGDGSVVWFTSSADRAWSDWTRSRLYLPLVYQLLGYQSGLLAGGRVREEILETQTASGSAVQPQASGLAPGIHERERYTLVVNGGPREAETDRASSEEFCDRFGLRLADDEGPQVAPPEQRVVQGTELTDNELWPWLAGCLLLVLVLEGLVANRTAG